VHELDQLTDINTDKDKDVTIDPHDMNISYGFEKILQAVMEREAIRIKKYIKKQTKADYARISFLDMKLDEAVIKPDSFYLPCYIYTTKHGEYTNNKFINGFTGEYNGKVIYSPWRIGGLTGLSGVAFTLLTLPARLNPATSLALIAVRVAIGAGIGGAIGGIWTRILLYLRDSTEKEDIENESRYNQTTEETKEDKMRKNFIGNTVGNHQNQVLYPYDECLLLGIDPTKRIDTVALKKYYHVKIRQWHPDIHPGQSKLANDMSIKINQAYDTLRHRVDP